MPRQSEDAAQHATTTESQPAQSSLNVQPEPEFEQFARLAATFCRTPKAAVTLMARGQQWIKGAVGLQCGVLPEDESFCIHTVMAGRYLDVLDATTDPRFAANPLVTGPEQICFYAGEPLIVEGEAVGALCVIDTAARLEGLAPEQRRALSMLAAQASLQLHLRRVVLERDRAAERLNAAVKQLSWAATHDHLTGLGNRALLRQALSELSLDTAAPFAMLAIDVDHFKQVNDTFGHLTGDELLKSVADRLVGAVREDDWVIRVGGDEFAVLLRDVHDDDLLCVLAGRILDEMRAPFHFGERSIDCRVTIGGARWPLHSPDVSEVVRYADAALYEAKAQGRGRFVLFEGELLAQQSRDLQEIERARAALDGGHVVPFYQPKVDLADGTILGLEALLRLVEPGCAPASPKAISAAFDKSEIAQALGSRLLRQVLDDMSRWIAQGLQFGRVAINVSATELGDQDFAPRLIASLAERGIPSSSFEIEILENVLLEQRSSAVLTSVRTLSEAGVRIAFDDFGTGYAALAHLPKFPVNTIKIDQSFVRNLSCPANQAIVRALVTLAEELKLEAVAEGVETTRQAVDLLALGCSIGQGFLFSEAIPAADIPRILQLHRVRKKRRGVTLISDRFRVVTRAA